MTGISPPLVHLYLYAFVLYVFLDSPRQCANVLDMITKSLETLRIMARFERALNRYVDLEMGHCGHQELFDKAQRSRERLMAMMEREIENLVLDVEQSQQVGGGVR
jgi:hypothetical protein